MPAHHRAQSDAGRSRRRSGKGSSCGTHASFRRWIIWAKYCVPNTLRRRDCTGFANKVKKKELGLSSGVRSESIAHLARRKENDVGIHVERRRYGLLDSFPQFAARPRGFAKETIRAV